MKTKIYTHTNNNKSEKMTQRISNRMSILSHTFSLILALILGVATQGNTQVLCEDFCDGMNLACNNQINVSINEDCYAAISTDLILEDPPFDVCPDMPANYAIDLYDEAGNYIIGHAITHEHVGQRLKATVTLIPCNISCWGYVYVEDKVAPQILNCIDGFLPPFIMDCDDFGAGLGPLPPQWDGVCTFDHQILTFVDDTLNIMCEDDYAVQIKRTYTVTDEVGHTDQCMQMILVEKRDVLDINMPDDYQVEYDGDCSIFDDVSPEVTGYPEGVFCPNIQFYYNDIVYPQCGRQRKLLRDWFVIDWCTGESRTDGQIIKIIDNTPPVVLCPSDTVYYPSNHYNCATDVILDPYGLFDSLTQIKIIDECSLPIHVRVEYLEAIEGQPQPKNGPYMQIQMNEDSTFTIPRIEKNVWVRYVYEDDCNNRSTLLEENPDLIDSIHTSAHCYFDVHIHDSEAPTAICEGFTKVQLGYDGTAWMSAESLDDHSFDPCGDISHFQIKRENTSCPGYDEHGIYDFGDAIHFCCEDIGDTLTVRLRVYDFYGNFSECLGLVCVASQISPQVTCPDDVTLECGDDFRDRDLIGVPTAENGCDANLIVGDDWFDLTDYDEYCGTGTIVRSTEVEDHYGNVLYTCYQNIYFDPDNDYDALDEDDFEFPLDVLLDQCAFGNNTHPDLTGRPVSNADFGCANIAITYKDDAPLYSYNGGICYTILRRWKIVDWCRFNPHYPDQHVINSVQEIKVKNTSVAQFNCPAEIVVDANGPDCQAYVDINIGVSSYCNSTLSVTYAIDLYSDNNIDDSGIGTNASDIYPVGTHTITFTAINHCGGPPSSCSIDFIVRGNNPPTPICIANLSWSLGFGGNTEVWASDFDSKSESGCNGGEQLNFSFVSPDDLSYPQPSQFFDCNDLQGGISASIPLEVYVIDESGLYESCSVYLQLWDSNDICPDNINNNMSITGKIMTETNKPVEEVMVELENMNEGGSQMGMTGTGGDYAFGNLSSYEHYLLKPYNNDNPLNGVSTLDLLLIQKHILGQETIASPYKLIAADVDNSGSVSAIDLIELRKLILGVYDDLPENDSWTFVPESHAFADESNPWDYPDYIDIISLNENDQEKDFVAVKIGDVNDSAAQNVNAGDVIERSVNTTFLSTYNQRFQTGELVSIPFVVDKSTITKGMQFTFKFDDTSLVFEGIDPGVVDVSQDNFALLNSKKGVITFSVNDIDGIQLKEDDVLFTCYFEARADADIKSVININSSVTAAEFYTEAFEINKVEMLVRELDTFDALEVFQNEPNPFDGSTSIAFALPAKQEVGLTVFSASGKILMKEQKWFDKGLNEFIINADDISASGILFYRVENESSSITRKMIVVK